MGWAVCFYGLPLFGPDAVNILARDFWTFCPEVTRSRKEGTMDKKRDQDFADQEVTRLCGVFGTPIPALPPERGKVMDKVKEPPRTSRSLEREER